MTAALDRHREIVALLATYGVALSILSLILMTA